MKVKNILLIFIGLLFISQVLGAEEKAAVPPTEDQKKTIDEIISRVEKKYAVKGTCSRFVQISTIKAMNISDTATGNIYARSPDMMRWEYETPDPQLIISDGEKLWLYRPEDNQVMVGKAPVFFGGGKGAGFLSDITSLKEGFDISLETPEDPSLYLLKLIPHDKALDLSVIYLFVSKTEDTLERIITYNPYGDETRVDLFDHKFNLELDDALFSFVIPKGTDIIQIDE